MAAPRRRLPFKRTASRKSIDAPEQRTDSEADDDLSLFKHSGSFFEEQKRLAEEKAAKAERERKGKYTNKQSRDELDDNTDDGAQPVRGTGRTSTQGRNHSDAESQKPKRRRLSLSSEDDDEAIPAVRKVSRKSSHTSPSSRRDSASARPTPQSSRSLRLKKTIPEIITLDDSDEDDIQPVTSFRNGRDSLHGEMNVEDQQHAAKDNLGSDSDPLEIMNEPVSEDELAATYIREARERARARDLKEAQTSAPIPDHKAEILIDSPLPDTSALKVFIKTSQMLTIVRESWIAKQVKDSVPMTKAALDSVFLTWRRNKLNDYTTLSSLKISADRDGRLVHAAGSSREGFKGWDRLHIQAWTPDLWDEHQREQERERRRMMGELDDEDDDDLRGHAAEQETTPAPAAKPVPQIKLTLKSRDMGSEDLKVPANIGIHMLIKAFQRRNTIPPGKTAQIVWDGEVLDPTSTVEDAGMENGDSVEVHIK